MMATIPGWRMGATTPAAITRWPAIQSCRVPSAATKRLATNVDPAAATPKRGHAHPKTVGSLIDEVFA